MENPIKQWKIRIKSKWKEFIFKYGNKSWPEMLKLFFLPSHKKPISSKHPKAAKYVSWAIMLFVIVSLVMQLFGVHLWH